MKLIEKYIEWLVAVSVVLITTYHLLSSMMETFDYAYINQFVVYLTILILFLIYLYQKRHYGSKVLDKWFVTFYLVYCVYILLDLTIFRIYPLDSMAVVPKTLVAYIFKLVTSIGYFLCAKTIVRNFNLRKYLLLSIFVCVIPTILFIQFVGVELIQEGIDKDDDEYVNTLAITFSNMPILVLAVMNFKTLFSKKWLSIVVCSGLILVVLFILLSFGKRGPILWSFVSIFLCFVIRHRSIKKDIAILGLVIATIYFFIDPVISILKEPFPKAGSKIEATIKDGDTSGRFNLKDTKHSTYFIGLENFSRSPVYGYYFRLVTTYQDFRGSYAHNVFIEILMTMGLLGFVPFMLLLLKAYKKSRNVFIHPHSPNLMACFILFLCVFLQLQTTNTCVFKTNLWFFFYVFCGIDKILKDDYKRQMKLQRYNYYFKTISKH